MILLDAFQSEYYQKSYGTLPYEYHTYQKADSNKTYFFQKQFKNGQHELFNNLFTAFFARFLPLCIALMSFHSFPYFKHVNQTFFLCNFLYNELYMFFIPCS